MSVLRAVLFTVALLAWLGILAFFSGPMLSGGLFLTWHGRFHPTEHTLPASYVPLHEGHIDIGTGKYVREDDDVVLAGTPPFVLRRTYRTNDFAMREFGRGASLNAEPRLHGDAGRFQWLSIALPDGSEIQYDRVSSGVVLDGDVRALGDTVGVLRIANGMEWNGLGASRIRWQHPQVLLVRSSWNHVRDVGIAGCGRSLHALHP